MSGDGDDDLGKRVLDARGRSVVDPPDAPRPWSGRLSWGAVVILIAGAIVFALVMRRSTRVSPTRGSVEAGERTEVRLAHRGTAVVDAGGAIRWAVSATGEAAVDHRRGTVFYRVQRGGAFVVSGGFGRIEAGVASFTVADRLTVHQGEVHLVCGDRIAGISAGAIADLPPCPDPG